MFKTDRQNILHKSPNSEVIFELPSSTFLLDPNSVHRRFGRSHILLFLVLIFLSGFFGLITLQGVKPLVIAYQIEQDGIRVQGSIVEQQPVPMRARGQSPVYYLKYRFMTDSQSLYDGEQVVSAQLIAQFQVGDSIPVEYLAYNPSLSALAGSITDDILQPGNMMVALLGVTGLILTLGSLAYWGWQLYWDTRLFKHGRLIMGHILSCHAHLENVPKNLHIQVHDQRMGGRYMIKLAYTFHTTPQKTIKAVVEQQRNDLRYSRLPEFGQRIAVLYLNDKHFKIL